MTLSQSLDSVKRCADQMNARYGKTVFNEWAIVSLQRGRECIVSYDGPRKEHFQKNFVNDLGSLRTEVLNKKHEPGHFDFSRNEAGTAFEAFVCVGDELYLICNHTEASMRDIARDTRWLEAQKPFAELTEQFRAQPLAA